MFPVILRLAPGSLQNVIFLLTAILAGGLLYLLFRKNRQGKSKKQPIEGLDNERSVRIMKKILSAYIKRSDGRVIYSAEVAGKKTSGSADAILVGYFGILVLVGCDLRGELYANDKDEYLTQIYKKERARYESPVIRVLNAQKAVNELLRQKKVYRVSVESAVVFTGKKAVPNVPGSLNSYNPKTLKKALRSGRFLDDKGVDTDAAAEALLGWR